MKIHALLANAILTMATSAHADPSAPQPRERALMLYFSKSFGGDQRQNRAPLAFGLRLQQSSPADTRRSVPMLDLRYSLDGHAMLIAADMLRWDPSGSSDENGSSASWGGHWAVYVGIGLGAAALACVTHVGICKDNKHGTDTSGAPYTPPGPPG